MFRPSPCLVIVLAIFVCRMSSGAYKSQKSRLLWENSVVPCIKCSDYGNADQRNGRQIFAAGFVFLGMQYVPPCCQPSVISQVMDFFINIWDSVYPVIKVKIEYFFSKEECISETVTMLPPSITTSTVSIIPVTTSSTSISEDSDISTKPTTSSTQATSSQPTTTMPSTSSTTATTSTITLSTTTTTTTTTLSTTISTTTSSTTVASMVATATTTAAASPPSLPLLSNTTGCGIKGPKRIISGSAAEENEFPWICSILNKDLTYYGCSSILLSCDPFILVTAAHCFARLSASQILRRELQVSCGDHSVSQSVPSIVDTSEHRLPIERVIIHPQYGGSSTFDNDIALIRSTSFKELQFTFICRPQIIWPACWPRKGEDYSFWGDTEVAGWGTTEPGSIMLPPVLQKAQVFPVSLSNCKLVMGSDRIKPGMICAAGGGTDTCQGDSGGPMTSQADGGGGYSLIGVTSWGDGCGVDGTFGVYARVGYYVRWIASQFGYAGVG